MWDGMKQIFGVSFLTIHGDAPNRFWVERIATLTDDACKEGLAKLSRGKAREYPPNLTEFVEACGRTIGSPRYLGVPMNDGQKKLLGRKKHPPTALGESHIAKMRERLARVEDGK